VATAESGFDVVPFDPTSAQYRSLAASQDDGPHVRDARPAGVDRTSPQR
jgi:hypothetical protein